MRLLVLGGTLFLGRHLVADALARGHDVTLFHRGRHGADLFPDARRVLGDRDGDLDRLGETEADVVVDTCGYVPRVVRASARRLAARAGRYLFVSTLSVYAEPLASGATEDAPLATLADPATERVDGETYGALKARCEDEVRAAWGERALVVRPGLIVGPHDPTDRFTYWPVRVARGGEVLVPEHPGWPVRVIDARDLAAWMLDLAEAGASGTWNAVGPEAPLPFGSVLDACRDACPGDVRFTWVDGAFLAAEGVQPWSELPLWVPDVPENRGHAEVDVARAVAAGLAFRPLAATARDTLAWARTRPPDAPWRAGLAPEREASLLARWHARTG